MYENPERQVEVVPKEPSALQVALSPGLRRTQEIWQTSVAHTGGMKMETIEMNIEAKSRNITARANIEPV